MISLKKYFELPVPQFMTIQKSYHFGGFFGDMRISTPPTRERIEAEAEFTSMSW